MYAPHSIPFDLEAEIAAIRERKQAERRAIEAAERIKQQERRQQEIARSAAAARESFGDLVDHLAMDVDNGSTVRVVFTHSDLRFALWYNPEYSRVNAWALEVSPVVDDDYSGTFYHKRLETATPRAELIAAIDVARRKHIKRVQEQAEAEREHAERVQQRAEEWGRIQAEDTECQAIVAAAKAEGLQALWRWPEGRAITTYRWTWCTATAGGDDGTEFDTGWSTRDQLDQGGYVRLEPADTFGQRKPRELRLDMQAHKPVVERRTFDSIDSLPAELWTTATVIVPGINTTHSGMYCKEDGAEYTLPLGRQPLEWVRTLVGQAS